MAALYRQIYEQLRTDIEQGRLTVGDRLPTETELARQHEVSAITVKKALDLLRQDGMIVRRPRLGTFVTAPSPQPRTSTEQPAALPLVGCVLTNFDDTFGTHLLGGLLDAAAGQALLVPRRSHGQADTEEQLIRELVASGIQALVLEPSSSEYVAPAVLELITGRFPLVIVDRVLERFPVSTVGSDNVAAARALTEHLFGLGHRSIGFVSASSHVSTLGERRQGFLLAHATFAVPHDEAAVFTEVRSTQPALGGDLHEDLAGLEAFVAAHPDLTAFVATEYNIALLLHEACRRAGLDVPGERSIVCFDSPDRVFDVRGFRYTHARQHQERIAALALAQALRQVADPTAISKEQLPVELVEGDSTLALRRRRTRRS
ncbi:GntR family transcriptional regulator [Desertihabitans brevis]|uniref:GntR family transcriptional regulator n=1 Tax=Desertihabitans brevis TaxID=2268447 RepID=A0A367YWL0_9ACTN|nr:GntR family transcriptional regulator [Desertihabitans brevis]RCK70210.1 GntR family transcriptional regulator [Desertihabitans brevis]